MYARSSVIAATAACLIALLGACTPPTVGKGEIGAAGAPAAAAAEEVKTAGWGQRYTWKDGLALEVAAPTACKPSQFAIPEGIERAVNFRITIINGTDKPVEAASFGFGTDAQFGNEKAERIFDSSGGCGRKDGSGTVLPGKTMVFDLAFAVAKAEGEMQMTFAPNMFFGDKAVFVGKA